MNTQTYGTGTLLSRGSVPENRAQGRHWQATPGLFRVLDRRPQCPSVAPGQDGEGLPARWRAPKPGFAWFTTHACMAVCFQSLDFLDDSGGLVCPLFKKYYCQLRHKTAFA
jgi:hypothetical protein